MDLSILVISKTYKLVNKLIKSLSDNKYLTEIKSEVLCSWNGLQKDLNKIIVTKDINLRIQMIKPYNFAINMNQLINMSTGKYILMINDDVFLDKNSIESGLNLLIKNKEIGIVGGLLRDRKGFLTHAGVSFNLLNSPYHFFEYLIKLKDVNLFNRSFFVPASTGALILSRKDTLTKVKFNELYNVCGEDIELCLDVRQILGN